MEMSRLSLAISFVAYSGFRSHWFQLRLLGSNPIQSTPLQFNSIRSDQIGSDQISSDQIRPYPSEFIIYLFIYFNPQVRTCTYFFSFQDWTVFLLAINMWISIYSVRLPTKDSFYLLWPWSQRCYSQAWICTLSYPSNPYLYVYAYTHIYIYIYINIRINSKYSLSSFEGSLLIEFNWWRSPW